MGFTVEDMLLASREKYGMEMVAGGTGWSNSISWMMLLEDTVIVTRFTGKEMAVTTGLGFPTEEKLLALAQKLTEHSASGLVLNTGMYLKEVPEPLIAYCNENSLPLLTVPWNVYLADMIKDLSIRIFLQGATDEQTSQALILAIENPEDEERYRENLLPVFHLSGAFQVMVIHREDLGRMDTVERKHLSYRLQLCLENLTHNGHFFYYDGAFVVIMNELSEKQAQDIAEGFVRNVVRRLRGEAPFFCGIGSRLDGIRSLRLSYRRAVSAAHMAKAEGVPIASFDRAGAKRLLYSVEDPLLLGEMGPGKLRPLLDYDREHHGDYVATLEQYLLAGGSVQEAAEKLFVHRNTVIYRMGEIRTLLEDDLKSAEHRMEYLIAIAILRMGDGKHQGNQET